LKQGDALPPLLFNFPLKHALGKPTKTRGIETEWDTSASVYAGDVYGGGGCHALKKNRDDLIHASKEVDTEVNADRMQRKIMT
jgi:hypothetical protein